MARPLDPVTAYADGVVRGKVPTGELVRLACERHLTDLKAGPTRGLRWDAGASERAIRFFWFLRHSKGEWAGTRFELQPWQGFIVGSLFGWKREDGFRRFRTAYNEVARKNGKSTLSAGIGLYCFLNDGEPGAEVYCLDESTPTLYEDLTWRPIGQAEVGQELLGFDEHPPEGQGTYRKARRATIEKVWRQRAPAYRIVVEGGRSVVCSHRHPWLSKTEGASNLAWRQTQSLRPGMFLRFFGDPWDSVDGRAAGWLAGIFDGEGYFHAPRAEGAGFRVGMSQKPGLVLDETARALSAPGFHPARHNLNKASVSPGQFCP